MSRELKRVKKRTVSKRERRSEVFDAKTVNLFIDSKRSETMRKR
jgi:hypothetical protein